MLGFQSRLLGVVGIEQEKREPSKIVKEKLYQTGKHGTAR